MHWDVFCRIVDNYGDVGVAWRLAADLAARGDTVGLWLDDASALAWLAPGGAAGVEVRPWREAAGAARRADVVVETFGCGLPDAYAAQLARLPEPPPWIDLEHLSAESYALRSHGLPSPSGSGPAAGLRCWYYYPGFDASSGGLLREPGLDARQSAFDRRGFLRELGIGVTDAAPLPRVVSLFCYENPALPALLDLLGAAPTSLLAAAGRPARQVEAALGPSLARGALQARTMARSSQQDYDRMLWSADLNFVRGEDSFVRAQWAGVPFVWQLYPQHDGAHIRKLEAFLDRFLEAAPADLAGAVRRLLRAWNGLGGALELPDATAWRAHCERWRRRLAALPDLSTGLRAYARSKMLK
jgi:uncharacterized repeat protein (TIGR03837 family)